MMNSELKTYADLVIEAKDLKMLREDLCRLQNLTNRSKITDYQKISERLQHLINEIDKHRPLGSDGKHGNLHTPTCGCEDK